MTDTPITDAERLAQLLEADAGEQVFQPPEMTGLFPDDEYEAATCLRAQAAEIERLREVLGDIAAPAAMAMDSADRVEAMRDIARAALKEKTDG